MHGWIGDGDVLDIRLNLPWKAARGCCTVQVCLGDVHGGVLSPAGLSCRGRAAAACHGRG